MTEWKKPKRVKIEPNLYRVGDAYYYRKGDFEESLGRFKDDKRASEYKALFVAQLTTLGRASFKFRVKDAWRDYMKERELEAKGLLPGHRRISQSTLLESKDIWRLHLSKAFATKRLAEVDDVLWNGFVKRLKVKDPTNVRKVLKTFLKWCKRTGKMTSLPELYLPQQERRERKVLSEDQVKAVLSNSEDSLLLFVAIYLFMGVRWSEQLRLQWENVNLAERWILITKETSRRTRKSREIPMNSFVSELLHRRFKAQQDAGLETSYVFPMRGKPDQHSCMWAPMNAWSRMMRRAGLDGLGLRPHDLRATYEHYSNLSTAHTDTQKEKMAGASMAVQRRIYLTGYVAKHLAGLEEVVQFDGLESILEGKLGTESNVGTGRTREGKEK